MTSTTANVVVFAFHDAGRAAKVVTAAGDLPCVVSVAVVGRSADSEIRIIARLGDELPEARWLASLFAVLDALSWPLRVVAGCPSATEAVTLPDSDEGFATFGRVIPPGDLVVMLALCDDSRVQVESLEDRLAAALYGEPSGQGRRPGLLVRG